ncbi:MAG: hypothetical protein HUU21_36605 [Polyangiaceae bacterium]|nr:hypothetical protein [Polyangiaceae bacterium]
MDVQTIRQESRAELRARILNGYPVDPDAIAGWVYRGTSLGLPRFVEKLTWKTFQKTFWREPKTGRLLGWNGRLEQDGIDAPSRPKLKNGEPITTWFYEVVRPEGVPMPRGFNRGLIIDYSRGNNPPLDTIRLSKDPLVAVEPGNSDVLLGVTYLALGTLCIETPTYFLLEREHRIEHVPASLREKTSPRADADSGARALFGFERRWAELLFDAVLGVGGAEGRPSLLDVDKGDFWRHLGEAAPPYFEPGLRATVHALTFLPVTMDGFRKPLFALSPDARRACMEKLDADPRLPVRQMVATAKILACFAYFEDEGVRARFEAGLQAPG